MFSLVLHLNVIQPIICFSSFVCMFVLMQICSFFTLSVLCFVCYELFSSILLQGSVLVSHATEVCMTCLNHFFVFLFFLLSTLIFCLIYQYEDGHHFKLIHLGGALFDSHLTHVNCVADQHYVKLSVCNE